MRLDKSPDLHSLQTFLVGLAYVVTAPLIAPVALLFFSTAYLTWRYAIVYVFERQYESGERSRTGSRGWGRHGGLTTYKLPPLVPICYTHHMDAAYVDSWSAIGTDCCSATMTQSSGL